MDNKYKLLGILLISFVIFFAWLWIKPKTEINFKELSAKNIDSLYIRHSDTLVVIGEIKTIKNFSNELLECKIVNPDNVRNNYDFIKLEVLTKRKRVIEILLFFTYAGKIINIEETYYKNDNLFALVSQHLK